MNRDRLLDKLIDGERAFDIAVIGGGATGASIALDAATRGYSVALLEQSDFGKGTSSRSTKLVHGGVRYLEQGNFVLVRDALRERSLLLKNASHLVHDLEFILPCRGRWEAFYFGIGLRLYDFLARSKDFGPSHRLSKTEVLQLSPSLNPQVFRSGLLFHDGQFDDSRLVINLVQTAVQRGAVVLNYASVIRLEKDVCGKLNGLVFRDMESDQEHSLKARCVINAAGPFGDSVRRLDEPDSRPMLAASQGVHLVLPRRFLPGPAAIIIPRTLDGRVLFLIPWHDNVLVGTTDTPIREVSIEPTALPEEIAFLLSTAGQYLTVPPTPDDVLSVFTGIRPLVLAKSGNKTRSSAISRDHLVHVAKSGLVSISGGKWTTVRKMAEDCVSRASQVGQLPQRACVTKDLAIHGSGTERSTDSALDFYGSDGPLIDRLIRERNELGDRIHPELPICGAQVCWSVRHEMARTVEDVLARRTRMLVLNARVAMESAPQVAEIVARELGRDERWQASQIDKFRAIACGYSLSHLLA